MDSCIFFLLDEIQTLIVMNIKTMRLNSVLLNMFSLGFDIIIFIWVTLSLISCKSDSRFTGVTYLENLKFNAEMVNVVKPRHIGMSK